MTRQEITKAYAGKTIYPNVHAFRDGDIITLETYYRKKGSDGKWYLCYFKRTTEEASEIGNLHKRLTFDINQMRLFGIVRPNVVVSDINPRGVFQLDDCQLSEEALMYMLDDLLFPKTTEPDWALKFPFGEEIMNLWKENFTPQESNQL